MRRRSGLRRLSLRHRRLVLRHEGVAVRPTAAWRVAPIAGVQATLDILDAGQGGGQALRLTFAKAGAERRFVAIEGKPEGDAAAAKALSVWYRLALVQGERPKLALVVFEKDGGAWFRTSAAPLALSSGVVCAPASDDDQGPPILA